MVRVVYHPQPGQEEYEGASRSGQEKHRPRPGPPRSNNEASNHGTGRHSSLTTSHRLNATRSRHSTPRTRGSRMISRPTAVTSDKVPVPILFKLNLSCATKKQLRVEIVTKSRRLVIRRAV